MVRKDKQPDELVPNCVELAIKLTRPMEQAHFLDAVCSISGPKNSQYPPEVDFQRGLEGAKLPSLLARLDGTQLPTCLCTCLCTCYE